MLTFASDYPEAMRALPSVKKEIDKLPRAYIANVIHTVVGDLFAEWINKRANARHEKVSREKDMIDMDPEIAAVY